MTPQEEIKLWLTGERDYSGGVALLQKYSKNKFLASSLGKYGKEKIEQNHRKLAYELGKLAGIKVPDNSTEKPGIEKIYFEDIEKVEEIKPEVKRSFLLKSKQWIKTLFKK